MNHEEFAFGHLEKRGFDRVGHNNAIQSEEDIEHDWVNPPSDIPNETQQNQDMPETDERVSVRRWKRPTNRGELENQFTVRYNALFSSNFEALESSAINDVIDILGQLATYVIYDRIWSLPVYREGDEEEITQDGHIAAFEKILQDIERGKPRENALFYYLTIYKNKIKDYLSFYGLLKREKNESDSESRKTKGIKIADIHAAPSIESLTTNSDGELQSERMADFSVNPFDDNSSYHVENCRQILRIYIEELLNNTNIPPAPLAVMYARILYQMERLLDADAVDEMVSHYMKKMKWSEDPADPHYDEHLVKATEKIQRYSNATAPDWAITRMGKQTVSELGVDSETVLHQLFDRSLTWGEVFRKQVESVSEKYAPLLWGAIVYTDCYKKSQIENWATDIHNSTVVKAARRICAQEDLLSYVLEELDEDGRLKGEVRKKQKKQPKQGGVCR